MLRDLTTLNPVESINQRKILPEMVRIGIGSPSTVWKANFMGCKWTINPKSIIYGLKNNSKREEYKKGGSKRTRDGENSTGNSGSENNITMS